MATLAHPWRLSAREPAGLAVAVPAIARCAASGWWQWVQGFHPASISRMIVGSAGARPARGSPRVLDVPQRYDSVRPDAVLREPVAPPSRRYPAVGLIAVTWLAWTLSAAPGLGACWSRSVGFPDAGRLRGGRALPVAGKAYLVQPFTVRHELRWGSCALVEGVRAVATSMAPHLAGKPLMIGNLSQRGGGDMPHSASHESGRDVDLGFLLHDDKGRPLPSYYHRFDRAGVSRSHGPRYRFDVARNWLLVRALLQSPHFAVERLVVAPWLRTMLLAHAAASDTPPALLALAHRVVVGPWPGVSVHDNHFHLRIACSDDDRRAGCRDRPLPSHDHIAGEARTPPTLP